MTTAADRPAGDDRGASGFRREFDEPLERVLDISTWASGPDLDRLYARLDREVEQALTLDAGFRERIRAGVFPRLRDRAAALPDAGVYRATIDEIRQVHHGLLFAGGVEAADGTVALHDTLPLSVAQIGVGLVSYQGDQGAWVHRLFRRDVRATAAGDPTEEVLDLLDRRRRRDQQGDDPLSRLARRGLMSYAERAVLLHKSTARWRMGHGAPAPVELLTGAETPAFLDASIAVLRGLLCEHTRWLFVPSAPADRLWHTLGAALGPLEYALLETMEARLEHLVERGPWFGSITDRATEFVREVSDRFVLGIYRASVLAPGRLFYAHIEHAHEAALIAIADSLLHEHRGFPMLIDLADAVCTAHFSAAAFADGVRAMYAAHGAPYRYSRERDTRKG
jgi:hypothetical protein